MCVRARSCVRVLYYTLLISIRSEKHINGCVDQYHPVLFTLLIILRLFIKKKIKYWGRKCVLCYKARSLQVEASENLSDNNNRIPTRVHSTSRIDSVAGLSQGILNNARVMCSLQFRHVSIRFW